MRELYGLLGVKGNPSTAYHPQSDGQTERCNQEVEQYLRLFCNHRQDDWAEWLSMAEFSYNNRIQASTRQTPFMLNSGKHPRLGTEPIRDTKVDAVDDFVKRMLEARKEAEAALHQAAEDMARFYDQHRGTAVTYKEGDQVWLDGKDLKTDRPSKKLEDKRYGPFTITKVIGPNAYKLQLPSTMKIHPVFNTVRLRPFIPDTIPGRVVDTRPPPVIIDDEPEYNIEYLKNSRIYRGKLQYLVKWEGYPHKKCTWEPVDALHRAGDAITEFHRKHPSAPRKISALTFKGLKFTPYQNYTTPPASSKLFDWTTGNTLKPLKINTINTATKAYATAKKSIVGHWGNDP